MSALEAELKRIEEMHKATTPGKWSAEWNGSGVNLKIGNIMIGTLDTEWCEEEAPLITAEEIEANGILFAECHNLVPRLLAALRLAVQQRNKHPGDCIGRRIKLDAELTETLTGKSKP